ncbi:Hyphal anastamosis 9 [Madurella fahalii]|uniref:Hyphal anastamosis 9 n=1 Tax=Madurella fahalii TaxID=1157608 RepID=A0ABQ0FZQ5_9PEZI
MRFATRERPHQEMLEKSRGREVFFSAANVKNRPNSVYTEFMESDFEMEHDDDHILDLDDDDGEVYSEFGDLEGIEDGESSPRISIGSSGQPSFTTLSTHDEVQTPRSLRQRPFPFENELKQQVEGPRGPHLFRSSMSSAQSIEFQHALSLSPITPKKTPLADFQLQDVHLTPLPRKKRDTGPFQFTDEELDTATLADWTPEMVAQRMLNAGVELPAAERFVENDINGAILITLKFEDLKELGISSFGVRTRIWEEIHTMRNLQQPELMPETPIDDEPDKAVKRELRRKESRGRQKPRMKVNDVISPLESVSIVGIEQVLPKPHNCSKGENCPKWKRNQRLLEAFKKDHPFIDDNGIIMIAGDPGNPETAEALNPNDEHVRPVSDAVPSVVASSDVMGPGSLPPLQYLQEATLRSLQSRDPQDNVRQFLDFQHHHLHASSEVPPTPPFEIAPQGNQQTPHAGLRSLPKLSIPTKRADTAAAKQEPQSARARSARPVSQVIPSFRELSPSSDEATPTAPYRFGTPFSEMDVPVTMTSIPPVSRDFSQSVPPDMNYRHNPAPPRSMSRNTIRRPSFPVMPALDENSIVTPITQHPNRSFSQRLGSQRPLQPPPRVQYPWTQAERPTLEKAIPPMPGSAPAAAYPAGPATASTAGVKTVNIGGRLSPISDKPKVDMTGGSAITYQGLMKKRKTKMLRHEWHEHFFTLRGTRLAMHKDAATAATKTLEYIDIDDYAIACSGMASGSKLNAAFKAMHIRRGSDDAKAKDVAAFSFQLIPQDPKGGVRLRKRESSLPSGGGGAAAAAAAAAGAPAGVGNSTSGGGGGGGSMPPIEGAVNGTGKTHHFAVKGRDERIDWMRELMLAKALKQKGEGFEVSVNGNMI